MWRPTAPPSSHRVQHVATHVQLEAKLSNQRQYLLGFMSDGCELTRFKFWLAAGRFTHAGYGNRIMSQLGHAISCARLASRGLACAFLWPGRASSVRTVAQANALCDADSACVRSTATRLRITVSAVFDSHAPPA